MPFSSSTQRAWLTPLVVLLAFAAVPVVLVYTRRCMRAVLRRAAVSKQLAGVLLILLVVVLWTGSSVAIQLVFETHRFSKPFFLTYASACLLTVYLPFYPDRVRDLVLLAAEQLPSREARAGERPRTRASPRQAKYSRLEVDREGNAADSAAESAAPADEEAEAEAAVEVPLGTAESLEVALRVGVLWFVLNLSFNVSLQLSSVSSVTIISATSSIWTLLVSAARTSERPTRLKVAATLLTFLGVLLVMLAGTKKKHDTDAKPHMLMGDAVALLSAITYGVYAVQVKIEVPSEKALPMPLLFGLIGLCCGLLLWPFLIILHLIDLEPFRWPSCGVRVMSLRTPRRHFPAACRELRPLLPGPANARQRGVAVLTAWATLPLPRPPAALMIGANALVGTVLSNMLLARAMLLASPLLATVGLSLAIPLAMVSDVLRERITHFSPALALGSLAVWAGFFALGAGDALEGRRRRLRSANKAAR